MQRIGPHVMTIDFAGDVTKIGVDRRVNGAGNEAAPPINATHRLVVADLNIKVMGENFN